MEYPFMYLDLIKPYQRDINLRHYKLVCNKYKDEEINTRGEFTEVLCSLIQYLNEWEWYKTTGEIILGCEMKYYDTSFFLANTERRMLYVFHIAFPYIQPVPRCKPIPRPPEFRDTRWYKHKFAFCPETYVFRRDLLIQWKLTSILIILDKLPLNAHIQGCIVPFLMPAR